MEAMVCFERMARDAGLPKKGMYSVSEVSKASGVCVQILYDEIKAGRLNAFLPQGRRRGQLIAPSWFDSWMEGGSDARE